MTGGLRRVLLFYWQLLRGSFASFRMYGFFVIWPLIDAFTWFFVGASPLGKQSSGIDSYLVLPCCYMLYQFTYQLHFTRLIAQDMLSGGNTSLLISPLRFGEFLTGWFMVCLTQAIVAVLIMMLAFYAYASSIERPFLQPVQIVHVCVHCLMSIPFVVSFSLISLSYLLFLGKDGFQWTWITPMIVWVLSAPFFTIAAYPEWIQWAPRLIPMYYLFESQRHTLSGGQNVLWANPAFVISSVVWLAASYCVYRYAFGASRKNGTFAKL